MLQKRISIIILLLIVKIMDIKYIWNAYSGLSPAEWKVESKQQCLSMVNIYSEEKFSLFRLSPHTGSSYQSYRSRSIYHISGTPKIIMSGAQIKCTPIQLFVQVQNHSIGDLLRKIHSDFSVLEKIKLVIRIVQILVKKYGPFRLTYEMLKTTKMQSIIVWINQQQQKNIRSYPIAQKNAAESAYIMLLDLLMIFEKYKKNSLLTILRIKIEEEKMITFEKSIMIIDKIICEKTNFQRMVSPPKHIIPDFLKKTIQIKSTGTKQKKLVNSITVKKLAIQDSIFSDNPRKIKKNLSEASLSLKSKKKSLGLIQIPQKPFPKSMFIQKKKNLFQKTTYPYKSMSQLPQMNSFQEIQDSSKTEKKNFRDSGNSLATTNFYHSITSSGRTRLLEEQGPLQKNITTSFGSMKCGRQAIKGQNRFQVKISKIIEENNCEDGTQNSPQSGENSFRRLQFQNSFESEIERDFFDVLFKQSNMMKQSRQMKSSRQFMLEEEINNILG